MCKNAPSLTHLFFFFADDSLLLIKANRCNAEVVKEILRLYEKCSGQVINRDKSTVMFSANTSDNMKHNFLNLLGIQSEAINEKYLGLPVYIRRSKPKTFQYLKEKV